MCNITLSLDRPKLAPRSSFLNKQITLVSVLYFFAHCRKSPRLDSKTVFSKFIF